MENRKLGNTDIQVAPIAFGGNVFGWTIQEETSFQILDQFTEQGFNLIDTADVYSKWNPGNQGGESEIIIGNWMKSRNKREQVVISSKVGGDMGSGRKGLSKDYIVTAVEASLKRLQTDYIDLYFSHFDDLETPVEETLEAYDQLIKAGKIRSIGASNFSPERLKEAIEASKHGLPKYQVYQPEYNLYNREKYESLYEPLIVENQLGVINYYALASGFLTGKYRSEADLSKSPRGGGVKDFLNEKGFAILDALDQVAEQHHAAPASVAIAWLIARPSVTAPIASVTNTIQLEDLSSAAALQLSQEDISLLDRASDWKTLKV
jgi:aryl-alcohol dehydrogenase-like predicted oxidoreductase